MPERTRSLEPTSWRQGRVLLVLLALVLFGFGLRLSGISQIGFAEDEINKLEAVRAYARGDITPNAEHPMLMKALMLVSMQGARGWNLRAGAAQQISDEAALRFPNVLFGALTVFPLFLLTTAFFGRTTGLLAVALWAFSPSVITFNRIAKEDTLLVFFMLYAFYFYLQAKRTSGYDAPGKRRQYLLSGAAFGLMLAAKYFPHYFGLNMLYHHFARVREREPGEPRGKTPGLFYLTMLVVFLLANPSVLLPQTWHYLTAYTSEQLMTHTGYLMGDRLYLNQMSSTLRAAATPVYFYLLFLLIKMPLPLLVALGCGLVVAARRWREPGAAFLLLMFILWIVPYSLVGAKWLRYTLSLMPFVCMIAAVGIRALAGWGARLAERAGARRPARVAGAAALIIFLAPSAWTAFQAGPHYALYTNALAAGRAGYYFPHDEFYDDGLREALRYVCERAPQGAIIAHETPGVARYYLAEFGRADLQSRVLSDPQFDAMAEHPQEVYVILQRGRTYFENQAEMNAIRARFSKAHEVIISGTSAAEVYSF